MCVIKSGTDINFAAQLLKKNKVVGIPTETVYGLAANAYAEEAILSVFKIKNRPFFDPLIVHVSCINQVNEIAHWHDERLKRLAEHFWPGPLSLLLPKKTIIPDIVTSGLSQVAVRMPQHPLCLELLNRIAFPLAAPSANPFGYISPTEAQHVLDQLKSQIDYVLDGGPCTIGLESSIVGIENNQLTLFRAGGISCEAIEQVAGTLHLNTSKSDNPKTPGQLKSHYAPQIPMYAGPLTKLLKKWGTKKVALLYTGTENYNVYFKFNLSPTQNNDEIARHMFRAFRAADQSGADVILISFVENTGLGMAINDRIARAVIRD